VVCLDGYKLPGPAPRSACGNPLRLMLLLLFLLRRALLLLEMLLLVLQLRLSL
jgi:hypothetical protein